MKWVLDASVAVKWVLPEKDSDKAADLRFAYASQVHDLIAPDIFLAEIAHALTKTERRGVIPPGEAAARLALILLSAPAQHAYVPLLPRAVAIASSLRMGVYDCLYIALAEQEGCDLVTADERLVKNAAGAFPVVSLADIAV